VPNPLSGSLAPNAPPKCAPGALQQDQREAEMVRRALIDREVFGDLYEIHYTGILNYLYRSTLDVNVAEELTSNTFFKALRGLRKYNHRAPFRIWLYRIATNEMRMHWRWKSTRRRIEGASVSTADLNRVCFAEPETETPEAIQERIEEYAALHRLLSRLPARYRTVLVLRYFENLSLAEVAQVLGKRLGTIKSTAHRGLARLKKLMEARSCNLSAGSASFRTEGGKPA